jgi:hypothetical protein
MPAYRPRPHLLATLLAVALAAPPALAAASTAPTRPGAHPAGAAAGPHVVVAIVEAAVNLYHHDFADPARTASPASWLPGYPASSTPLRLHLRERDYATARTKDDATWAALKPDHLYYVPGTRFAGLIYLPSPLDKAATTHTEYPPPAHPDRPVVDGYTYHGTGVASVAAGAKYGACPRCDLVVVAAENPEDGLAWAARQPWIDVVSNSWGGLLGVASQGTTGHPERAADTGASPGSLAAKAGKVVVFGSGNGVTDLGPTTHGTQHALTWDEPYAGPPWVLAVGAAKARTGQPTDWHNIPVDVIAQGEERPAAAAESLTGQDTFIGTSCAAPIAAGVIAAALLAARDAAGDLGVGARHGSLLVPKHRPPAGPAADGKLTYAELLAAAKAVAAWHAFDPGTVPADPFQAFATPTTPVAYAYEGFGQLDKPSVAPLARVLLGTLAQPPRAEMADWVALDRQVRSNRWGAAPSP